MYYIISWLFSVEPGTGIETMVIFDLEIVTIFYFRALECINIPLLL